MAADTAMWSGRTAICGHRKKITHAKDGSLIGVCGSGGAMQWFPAWFDAGCRTEDIREPDGEFQAMVVSPSGEVTIFDSKMMPVTIENEYHAAGGAEIFLLGAMAAGASVSDAVRLAIEHTDQAGGTVQVERLRKTVSIGLIDPEVMHG